MRRLQAMTGVAAIAAVSGCAPALVHTSAEHTAAAGTVTGKLEIEGGPISTNGQQPGKRPTPGTVRFTSTRHHRVTVRVGDSGTFSVRLPPGTYAACSLSAGASGPCSKTRQVTVTAQHTTKIAFTFFVP
ncbi:MAG TPA: hypothetical protein VMC83_21875 [Streptosporangiaceae bacterium]|nr:hypothetical protein [Streptosporangiaceae bacterium]